MFLCRRQRQMKETHQIRFLAKCNESVNGNLREHKRVEHGKEEVDCQEVKEDSWLHCDQGSNIFKP